MRVNLDFVGAAVVAGLVAVILVNLDIIGITQHILETLRGLL